MSSMNRSSSSSSQNLPAVPPFRYDFGKGHPNADELPVEELQAILGHYCLNNDGSNDKSTTHQDLLRTALQYGAGAAGSPTIRGQLAAFLERQCRDDELLSWFESLDDNDDDDTKQQRPQPQPHPPPQPQLTTTSLFVTEGVSHSIDLLVSALTQPGDVVWTERPTYYLAAGIFQSHGLRVEALPMMMMMQNNNNNNGDGGGCGIDMDRLEAQLHSGQRVAPRLLYIIPAYQNPMGHSLAAAPGRLCWSNCVICNPTRQRGKHPEFLADASGYD